MVLTSRVRDPVDHYLSTYLWATAHKPNIGHERASPRVRKVGEREHAVLPQPSFAEWTPSNLQTALFVDTSVTTFVTKEQSGRRSMLV